MGGAAFGSKHGPRPRLRNPPCASYPEFTSSGHRHFIVTFTLTQSSRTILKGPYMYMRRDISVRISLCVGTRRVPKLSGILAGWCW